MNTIHPTAIVHPDAILADGVEIGPYVFIEENAQIGEGTRIESANRICSGARIGKNCRVMHGAAIATNPQSPPHTDTGALAFIGDDTVIREFVTVNRGMSSEAHTVIGSHCMIMAYCHIAYGCTIGDTVIMANGIQMGAGACVQDFAIIGGMTGIKEGARVGKYCMVSGSAFVHLDVPPFALAGREPLVFEGLNSIGLRRRHFAPATIAAIDSAYSLLFTEDTPNEPVLDRIAATWQGVPEIDEIITFVRTSGLGLVHPERQ